MGEERWQVIKLRPAEEGLRLGFPLDARVMYREERGQIRIIINNLSSFLLAKVTDSLTSRLSAYLEDIKGRKRWLGEFKLKGRSSYYLEADNIGIVPSFRVKVVVREDELLTKKEQVLFATDSFPAKPGKGHGGRKRERGIDKEKEAARKEDRINSKEEEQGRKKVSKRPVSSDKEGGKEEMKGKEETGDRQGKWSREDNRQQEPAEQKPKWQQPAVQQISTEDDRIYIYRDGEKVVIFQSDSSGGIVILAERMLSGRINIRYIDLAKMRIYQPLFEQ